MRLKKKRELVAIEPGKVRRSRSYVRLWPCALLKRKTNNNKQKKGRQRLWCCWLASLLFFPLWFAFLFSVCLFVCLYLFLVSCLCEPCCRMHPLVRRTMTNKRQGTQHTDEPADQRGKQERTPPSNAGGGERMTHGKEREKGSDNIIILLFFPSSPFSLHSSHYACTIGIIGSLGNFF